MIERYLTDEFSATDKNLSNGKNYFFILIVFKKTKRNLHLSIKFNLDIDFDEFKSIYKRLFLQCRSVVLHDVGDIIDDRVSYL